MTSAPATLTPERSAIDPAYTWDLSAIFPSWEAWEAAMADLEQRIGAFKALAGTLGQSGAALRDALQAHDAIGQLSYRVWYYPSLTHDQDQRDNTSAARRQRVQLLFARLEHATSWFNPELLTVPPATIHGWMAADPALAVYRFAVDDLFRKQAHVLDHDGERLLSLASRLSGAPRDAYESLTTADARFPTIRLSTGADVQVTYGQYRRVLATSRVAADRRAAFDAHYDVFGATRNTYAALYNGVLHRDWFQARARGYATTLDAALFGDAIPPAVVTTLIAETRAGIEPFRRYHRLRKRALGLAEYTAADAYVPLVEHDVQYRYDDVRAWIVESTARLGSEYQARVREAFDRRWIDVYENQGKRSGAYSAPVYGAHPYMLLNYNDTLDAVFTLAHEMGHSMHTLLAHAAQPFVYAGYTIFVAEVPSTLNEELLLELMLERVGSREEGIVLLQHAIDGIVGTFYNQVLFADFELEAHRMVERDEPITAESLTTLYNGLLDAYWGDAISRDERLGWTWARIPHFYQSPYYVYQYATCMASTAALMQEVGSADPVRRADGVARYLALLAAGGSDHPMTLLTRAGVDLSEPTAIRALVAHLDRLVGRLEAALA
ncbi:MAG: oligoendopeptidase F [Vicinamibacterales bacterium]